jgi:hypothetical protein
VQLGRQLVVVGIAALGGVALSSGSMAEGHPGEPPARPAATTTTGEVAPVVRFVHARGDSAPAEAQVAVATSTTSTTGSASTTTTATTAAPTTTSTTAAPTTTTTPAPPPPPPPPPASPAEDAIRRWFGDVYDRAHDIAWCESRLDPAAVSPGGGNHGLFQINDVHRDDFARVTGVAFVDGRYDPYLNSQFARWLYDAQGWEPWACA